MTDQPHIVEITYADGSVKRKTAHSAKAMEIKANIARHKEQGVVAVKGAPADQFEEVAR